MAIKYTLSVNTQKNQDWFVEIDVPSYEGDPIALVGDRNPILLEELGGGNDDPFSSHILTNSLTIRVYDDNVSIPELQLIDDASVKCRAYLNGVLKHQGFIISDGIQETDSGVSALITIKSIDGLELLDAIPFVWGDNYRPITVDGQESAQRCPMNIIRLCLYRFDLLDNILPIRWATSLKSNQYPNDDMLAGRNKLNYDGKLTQYGNQSARWYLEEICRTAHCWLYQKDGYWWIENRGDTIRNGGVFNGYEITTSTSEQIATPISIDLNTSDLANEFIEGDQYWMTKKPLGGVNVTYNATVNNSNVLPNGSMDNWSLGVLRDWGWRSNLGDGTIEQYESLQNREGSAAQLTNDGSATSNAVFTMTYQMPVDSKFLYRSFLWGFTIMPTRFGFPYDGQETIDWSSNPLQVSVIFKYQDKFWYLNEFGYWQSTGRGLNLGVLFVRMDYQVVSNPPFNYYNFQARFEGTPNVGDVLVISIRNSPGGEYVDYTHTVTLAEEGILQLALEALLASIPNTIDGFGVDNKAVFMDSSTSGYVRFRYSVPLGLATGSTYKGSSTQEYQYIYPTVDQLKINDIATIAFQGKGGNSEILLPEISELQEVGEGGVFDRPPNGIIDFLFYVKPGQRYVLDDIYMSVQDNDDRYEIRASGSKSPIENYDVGISSGFTGFQWSSYMDDFGKTNIAMFWGYGTGGGFDKTLTQLYGEFIMDWRNTPRKVFDGSIDRIVQAGDFLTIKGRKYIVLNATIQGDGITRVLAFEAALSPKAYAVTHKGTLDNNT